MRGEVYAFVLLASHVGRVSYVRRGPPLAPLGPPWPFEELAQHLPSVLRERNINQFVSGSSSQFSHAIYAVDLMGDGDNISLQVHWVYAP